MYLPPPDADGSSRIHHVSYPVSAQRALAKKIGATTTEVPTSHVPMVSSPEAVAKVIIEASRAAAR